MHCLLNRTERYLFYFLLFAIPFQTRKILWHQNWNFNEWQSISLYATDLLLMILFLFWAVSAIRAGQISNFKFLISKQIPNPKSQFQNPNFYLLILVIISAISIKNSSSFILSSYNVLKLAEFVVLYFYLKSYAIYKFGFNKSLLALIYGGVFQAIIAILQFFKQSSLGLGLLGESVISPNLTGIASFYNIAGEKIIRAYGTTPHPNILAGYLFLAIFAFYFIYIYRESSSSNKHYDTLICHSVLRYWWICYTVLLFGLFFTFARVAVFILLLNFLIRVVLVRLKFRKEYWNKKLGLILLTTTIVVVLFGGFYWSESVSRIKISSGEEAVQLRIFYNKESLKSLNWFGVGSGNFVNWLMTKDPNLPRGLYQPVHNIYLLIYSETGILGITAFVLFLIFRIKDFIVKTKMEKLYHYSFLLVFLSFLFVGLFDHFLWTLQQGRFIFWLVVALLTLLQKKSIVSLF